MNREEAVCVEVRLPLEDVQQLGRSLGIDADYFESDALIGDPATIAIISLVGVEVVRLIQVLVSELVKRDRSVEIRLGNQSIRAASVSDIKAVRDLLNDAAGNEI
ncbi:MAG: hypothetical protein LBJ08_12730 [Bifidobacteriaceae bacterium]|jgi:hypothetical protein|nr:hypothetical protein [Bifidobacteriaceae bacterium]